VTTASDVNPGFRRKPRTANLTSCHSAFIVSLAIDGQAK
jgi:hypothetical protein